MSIFNPNDFTTNNETENILTEVADNYLRNNGITNSSATTSFLGDVNLTSNTNISGNILANGTTISPTELSYLDNVTSNIQQQINNISGGSILNTNNIFTGINQFNNDIVVNSTNISPTELSYINNTTSNIQTQINTSNINIDTINTTLTNNGVADLYVAKLSSITGIAELNNNAQGLHIYPNPTKNMFTLEVSTELKNASIEMYNAFGQKVYASKLVGRKQLVNCTSFASGVYEVKVFDEAGLYSNKLIIE